MEKMETIIYSDFWSKWGSHMCDSQVSWGACFLRSDSCPSSVGTGPGSVATSPPDPLVLCSQSTVAPAVLCGIEFSSQSFPDGEPPFWFLLEPCRAPSLRILGSYLPDFLPEQTWQQQETGPPESAPLHSSQRPRGEVCKRSLEPCVVRSLQENQV